MISTLLQPLERTEHQSITHWFNYYKQTHARFELSIERAIWAGRSASCLGYAFAGAYQAAIENLFAEYLDPQNPELASLCVSETAGNHPKQIQTQLSRLEGAWQIDGLKSFVSGAQEAQAVFVVCRLSTAGAAQADLKVVKLSTQQAGLSIETMPTLAFVPEVSHGKVKLDRVALAPEQILPGDGYLNYMKPFRTVEDLHVSAAVAGYLLGESLAVKNPELAWPAELKERLIALLLTQQACAQMPWQDPALHLAMAGMRTTLNQIIKDCDVAFNKANSVAYEHWQRDQKLLQIASKAGLARTAKARAAFS